MTSKRYLALSSLSLCSSCVQARISPRNSEYLVGLTMKILALLEGTPASQNHQEIVQKAAVKPRGCHSRTASELRHPR